MFKNKQKIETDLNNGGFIGMSDKLIQKLRLKKEK